MTRINAFIPVSNLTDNHLVAELKEINQLVGQFNCSIKKQTIKLIPSSFTLNKGHVKFFYNKGYYLEKRFKEISNEMILRKFNVKASFNFLPYRDYPEYFQDYIVDLNEIKRIQKILIERISSNLLTQKNPIRYYKKIISYQEALNILKR